MKTRIKAYWDKELKRWYGISAWGLDWDEFECVLEQLKAVEEGLA